MTVDKRVFDPASLDVFASGDVREGRLISDTEIAGLPCCGGDDVVFHRNGAPRWLRLAAPTRIAGVHCAAGSLFLHPDGRPWNCALQSESVVNGVALPEGTRVTFDEAGRVLEHDSSLAEDAEVQGVPCSADFPVWWHANGALSCCVLAREHTIGGADHRPGTELFFAPDGELIDAVVLQIEPGVASKRRVFGAVEVDWS